jgi:hypothetical protein
MHKEAQGTPSSIGKKLEEGLEFPVTIRRRDTCLVIQSPPNAQYSV